MKHVKSVLWGLFASLSLIFGVTAAAAGQEDGSSYWDRNLGLRSVTRGT